MRHRVKTKTFHRDKDHRKSLFRTLATQLVEHESVVTTVDKAKYLRPRVEKLVTRAKKGNDFSNVKYMKAKLSSDDAVRKILEDLGPRFKSRPGGYTRIVKIGERDGDNASMARIEFVERPKKESKKVKKTSGKEKKDDTKENTQKEDNQPIETPKKGKGLLQRKTGVKKIEPKQMAQRQKRISNV